MHKTTARLAVLLVLSVAAAVSWAQTSTVVNGPLPPKEQVKNTLLMQPECDPSSNSYFYTVLNSISSDMSFNVVLDCDGVKSSQTVKVLAGQPSARYSISPAKGSVKSRLCNLELYGRNPYPPSGTSSLKAQRFDRVPTTCGPAPNPENDPCNYNSKGEPRHGYFEIQNQFTDNSWWNNFVCVYVIITSPINLVMWGIFTIWWFGSTYRIERPLRKLANSYASKEDMPKYDHSAYMQTVVLSPDQHWQQQSYEQQNYGVQKMEYTPYGPPEPQVVQLPATAAAANGERVAYVPVEVESPSNVNIVSRTEGHANSSNNVYASHMQQRRYTPQGGKNHL